MNIAALSYNIKKPPKGGGTFRRPGTEDRSDPILWQQKIDSKRIKIFLYTRNIPYFGKRGKTIYYIFVRNFQKKCKNEGFLWKKKYCARKYIAL